MFYFVPMKKKRGVKVDKAHTGLDDLFIAKYLAKSGESIAEAVLCGRWADLCRSLCCKLSGTEADKFGVRICFLIKLKQNLKIS